MVNMIYVCDGFGFQGIVVYYVGIQFMSFVLGIDCVDICIEEWICFQQVYCFCYYIKCVVICFQYFLFVFDNF